MTETNVFQFVDAIRRIKTIQTWASDGKCPKHTFWQNEPKFYFRLILF